VPVQGRGGRRKLEKEESERPPKKARTNKRVSRNKRERRWDLLLGQKKRKAETIVDIVAKKIAFSYSKGRGG